MVKEKILIRKRNNLRCKFFYICEDCREMIPSRLDTILNMKNPYCCSCYNIRKGVENKNKIREATLKQMKEGNWRLNSLTDEEKLKMTIRAHKTLRKMYASGELKAWNDGIHIQTNTGRTHFPKGRSHPNWIDGASSSRNKRGEDWNIIKHEIYKRDDYTCQYCGKINIKIFCHHIIPYRETKDNNFDNLITLCQSCHSKLEQMYFYPERRAKYFGIINCIRFKNLEDILS